MRRMQCVAADAAGRWGWDVIWSIYVICAWVSIERRETQLIARFIWRVASTCRLKPAD